MEAGKDYIGVGVGILLFNEDGQVLLIHRSHTVRNDRDKWSIPGGEVEFWETASAAMVRETTEEVGVILDVKDLEPVGYIDNMLEGEKQHWMAQIFTCSKWSGVPSNMEPEKCQGVQWFHLDELPQNITFVAAHAIGLYKEGK